MGDKAAAQEAKNDTEVLEAMLGIILEAVKDENKAADLKKDTYRQHQWINTLQKEFFTEYNRILESLGQDATDPNYMQTRHFLSMLDNNRSNYFNDCEELSEKLAELIADLKATVADALECAKASAPMSPAAPIMTPGFDKHKNQPSLASELKPCDEQPANQRTPGIKPRK